jgi:hypothetical protein
MMTEQEQIRALAEIDGYVWYRAPIDHHFPEKRYRFLALPAIQEYEGQIDIWKVRADGTEKIVESATWLKAQGAELPAYDLNNLRRMEKDLDNKYGHLSVRNLSLNYWIILMRICNPDGEYYKNGRFVGTIDTMVRTASATIDQRREAMLRAHGKWKE